MGKHHYILPIIIFLSFATTLQAANRHEHKVDSLMEKLQEAIDNREAFIQQKESRIVELRKEISAAENDNRRSDALDALINEYNSYNTDSALAICRRRELLARKNGNPVMNEGEEYGLAYEEFIALNTYMIQKQQKTMDALTRRVDELEKGA